MAEALALRDARKFGYDAGLEQGITKGRAEGISQGMATGLSQGIAQGRIESARNLLHLNLLSPEQIASVTGLSLAEVMALS